MARKIFEKQAEKQLFRFVTRIEKHLKKLFACFANQKHDQQDFSRSKQVLRKLMCAVHKHFPQTQKQGVKEMPNQHVQSLFPNTQKRENWVVYKKYRFLDLVFFFFILPASFS